MKSRNRWLTVEELATELRISQEKVFSLVTGGQLEALDIDGIIRVSRSALQRLSSTRGRTAVVRRKLRPGLIESTLALAIVCVIGRSDAKPPQPGEVVPRQIAYRGFLDENGVPVNSERTPMRFELFTADTGGSAVWTESQDVPIANGQFAVALGDGTAVPPSVFAQPNLFLQISVNGQQLAGRQRLLSVPYAQYSAASAAVPVGSITAFGGQNAPLGWLPCNGQVLKNAEYPALYSAIGTLYGAGEGATFKLPDLRGRFPRGFDLGAGRDAGSRDSAQFEDWATALPRAKFTTEASDVKHTHNYLDVFYAENWCDTPPLNGLTSGSGKTDNDNNWCEIWRTTESSADGELRHSHAVGGGGDKETRPANVAVSWIIRAAP